MFLRKIKFTRDEFDDVLRPAVYAALRGSEPIYIGYSKEGYSRVFMKTTAHRNRHKAFEECDGISVRFYSTKEKARADESTLIHRYHPIYNELCVKCRPNGKSVLEVKDRYLKLVSDLVKELGGIPGPTKLREMGVESLYQYTLSHKETFANFPRL